MTEKLCSRCGEVKPKSEFYRHPTTADGYLSSCKLCHKFKVMENRRNNPEVRAAQRRQAKHPKRMAAHNIASLNWHRRNPEAHAAHGKVFMAVRSGKISRNPCEVCGSSELVHAHHADYSMPLDVTWLCPLHHARLHAGEITL